MLLGVADATRAPIIAEVLAARGIRALVVRGDDGLDEISTTTTTSIWDVTGDSVVPTTLNPQNLGFDAIDPALLVGGDRVRNAQLLRQVIGLEQVESHDERRIHAIRDVIALNAAAALVAYAALSADGLTGNLHERIAAKLPRAQSALKSGAAADLLKSWIAKTQEITASH